MISHVSYDPETRTLTIDGQSIVLPTDAEMAAQKQQAELDLERATALRRQAEIDIVNAQRQEAEATARYERAVERLQKQSAVAFVCLIAGSILLVAAVTTLWVGVEIYPRRFASMIALGWFLLAPWAFAAWAEGWKKRQ